MFIDSVSKLSVDNSKAPREKSDWYNHFDKIYEILPRNVNH